MVLTWEVPDTDPVVNNFIKCCICYASDDTCDGVLWKNDSYESADGDYESYVDTHLYYSKNVY